MKKEKWGGVLNGSWLRWSGVIYGRVFTKYLRADIMYIFFRHSFINPELDCDIAQGSAETQQAA
jgi:hypothetical protein